MSNIHQKAKPADGRPATLDEFLNFARKGAPRALGYHYDEIIDGRPLRPGEMMRIVSMIRGDGYRENDMESVEARCAAALVAARIGLDEAIPSLRGALSKEIPDPLVKGALAYALGCLCGMVARGTVPCKGHQIKKLLEMRDSAIPAERRLADIVIEKAAIRYGTVSSW
jgi:hypothetical protein